MDAFQEKLAGITAIGFDLLQALGALLALLVVGALFIAVLRSIWGVTVGRATLILPFRGAEKLGIGISGVLAQQLPEIEKTWNELSERVRAARGSDTATQWPSLVDLGRSHPDATLDEERGEVIASDPLEGQAIGKISLGAISFYPDSLFTVTYQMRTLLARRTIRGTVDQVGDTVRLSTTLISGRGRRVTTVLVRQLEQPAQLLGLIDDMAFRIAAHRLGLRSEARTWAGYRSFVEGYVHHARFERTGMTAERDVAIEKYQQSVALEPDYHLAHYNLGALLYNRYTPTDNDLAIQHLGLASSSSAPALRALALGELARAYVQQVQRFGHTDEAWIALAEEASLKAVEIAPDLLDIRLARGFALQCRGRYDEAMRAYQGALDAPAVPRAIAS